MSEKRFVYGEEHYNFPMKKRIRDTQNNETYIDLEDVCQKLNELAEENEHLRNFIELMNMRQKWKLYNYKRDNDE